MPKSSPIQGNFSAGELSPRMAGRTDIDRYKAGVRACKNYLPILQGAVTRRPGSMFIVSTKNANRKARLLPFQYSTTQAYILEVGHQYIRFYRDRAQLLSGLAAFEVATTYQESQVFDINFTQSADVLYLVHPSHPMRKLLRFAATSWELATIDLFDGPYLSANATDTTLTPSGTTGSITITTGASRTISNATNDGTGRILLTSTAHGFETGDRVLVASVGGVTAANGEWTAVYVSDNTFALSASTFAGVYTSGGTAVPAVFASTDVGRLIRVKQTNWARAEITGYTNGGSVTALVDSPFDSTSSSTNWRLGAFSATTGYPTAVTFHEDRLVFLGEPEQAVHGSRTGDYENFSPTDKDGTVTASHAVSFNLNSSDVNKVRWGVSDEKGLLVGTVGGEWVVRSASTTEALSPTSINAKRVTSYGSQPVGPVQSGKAVLYIQDGGRKLRELNYFFDVDGFRSTDLTFISDHITLSGVVQMAFQTKPHQIIWCVRNDGVLAAMTYDRDVDGLQAGWSRQILGGVGDAAGNPPVVESVATIPSPDGTKTDVWLIVKRFINGSTVRMVELLGDYFEDDTEQKDAFFLDCGLSYDDPLLVENVSLGATTTITSTAHGLSNGDRIRFYDVDGTIELNGAVFTVSGATTNSFQLSGIDSTAYGVYVADSGEFRKLVSTISGLDHLEGETVGILADGAVQPSRTVSGGSITLQSDAAVVHVGYNYNSDGQLMRLEAGAADGTAMGKVKRTNRLGFMLHRSLNLLVGPSFEELDRVIFRSASDPMDTAPALFTGIISTEFSADYDFDNFISWRQDQPLPSTVLAVFPQLVTQDR